MVKGVNEYIDQVAQQLHDKWADLISQGAGMIGIRNGGVWVAQELHRRLKPSLPLGTLDISFYRDDFSRVGLNPQVKPSQIPFAVEDRPIILVDDVLQTGRTIRAAMNKIFDYGRPSRIVLVCLLQLPGRELPIQADVLGEQVQLPANQRVKLLGPAPLKFEIITLD